MRVERTRTALVTILLEDDEHGEPRHMRCTRCGARAAFDQTLPYVNQTASFGTDHECTAELPART